MQDTFYEIPGRLPTRSNLLSSFRGMRNARAGQPPSWTRLPHQGALCHVEDDNFDLKYVIEIALPDEGTHDLYYTRNDFEFAQRLFAILDAESKSFVDRSVVKEFVTLRCPVFWRRDDDLRSLNLSSSDRDSPTFDEIWNSVVSCSNTTRKSENSEIHDIGVEGWMVFCRFIALAQYLEAKRRFLARHLQQTMRHRNSPRGSEVVVVEVPPPEPPAPLSPLQLASYEEKSKAPLPLPELDLDHSLVAAHDAIRRRPIYASQGEVKISPFGPSFSSGLLNASTSSSPSNLEFAVTFIQRHSSTSTASRPADELVVRRSMADMKWLDDTFASHKVLGGTLCGRILPPFPGTPSRVLSSHFQRESDSVIRSSIKSTTGGAIKAAASSVGLIRDVAKSFFGGYLSTGSLSADETAATAHATAGTTLTAKKQSSKRPSIGRVLPESYYNPNSPASKARQLERYLNYLLEHPALSTSFPLNTILKASQSGLDAAKVSLEECHRASRELKAQAPQLDDGKVIIPFWPSGGGSESSNSPNLAWVRTAAQAAMALKVHGMLETTGLNSASARLQHASLPSFGTAARSIGGWEDDEGGMPRQSNPETFVDAVEEHIETNNFEDGVVSVRSELQSEEEIVTGDDGYDLLPLPVPAPERRILSAGSEANVSRAVQRENRFHYGVATVHKLFHVDDDEPSRDAFLGDISVDENIDKLREVIGSVDNTLSRCLASIAVIGKSQRERQNLHLELVRGLDSWAGMRGKFVSQRSLMKGVAGIEQSKELYEEGDVAMIDDLSWQTSLANAAVAAAEDVRSAVRVSRTATSAKAAASSAAFAAQHACDTGDFSSIDEARAARTRASIAQSHAIHAAVVEHEAKTVKRRATLALANDVKCWNIHRKREMLLSCISYARSQHEATRRAVDAWSSLRDGFIGTTVIPTQDRRQVSASVPIPEAHQRHHRLSDLNEVTATIYPAFSRSDSDEGEYSGGGGIQPAIVAVDHNILSSSPLMPEAAPDAQTYKDFDNFDGNMALPFATAAPIPEEDEDALASSKSSKQMEIRGCPSGLSDSDAADPGASSSGEEKLSASMQSLVDGLMNWGGGFETEEDHFALPVGMAASIAMEQGTAHQDSGKVAQIY